MTQASTRNTIGSKLRKAFAAILNDLHDHCTFGTEWPQDDEVIQAMMKKGWRFECTPVLCGVGIAGGYSVMRSVITPGGDMLETASATTNDMTWYKNTIAQTQRELAAQKAAPAPTPQR